VAKLSRRKEIVFGVLVAGFTFGAIELMGQAFYFATAGDFLFRRATLPLYEPDPVRCFRLKPGLEYSHRTNEFDVTIYTNAQNMRTDARRAPVSVEKPPGTRRALFLGPSFTFGWANEYEQAYATLIGEALRAAGHPIEIVNMGTPAQGVDAQSCWLEREGHRFDPDVVIQTVYGPILAPLEAGCPASLECPIVRDSRLHTIEPTLARTLIYRIKNLATVFYGYYAWQAVRSGPPADGVGTGKELHGESARAEPSDLATLVGQYQAYQEFVRRVVGADTQVIFLFVPLSFVVHPEDAARWTHILKPDPEGSRARIRDQVRALRDAGIAIVDTTEALRSHAASERVYYWLDIHLTPLGNRVVAEAAVPVFLEQLRAARGGPAPPQPRSSASSPASSMTSTPSSRARSSLLPGSAPATT
jgi:hypothetical protein